MPSYYVRFDDFETGKAIGYRNSKRGERMKARLLLVSERRWSLAFMQMTFQGVPTVRTSINGTFERFWRISWPPKLERGGNTIIRNRKRKGRKRRGRRMRNCFTMRNFPPRKTPSKFALNPENSRNFGTIRAALSQVTRRFRFQISRSEVRELFPNRWTQALSHAKLQPWNKKEDFFCWKKSRKCETVPISRFGRDPHRVGHPGPRAPRGRGDRAAASRGQLRGDRPRLHPPLGPGDRLQLGRQDRQVRRRSRGTAHFRVRRRARRRHPGS